MGINKTLGIAVDTAAILPPIRVMPVTHSRQLKENYKTFMQIYVLIHSKVETKEVV